MTIGSDRPPGATGYDELVSQGRSALKITSRAAGDLAIVGYTSGTTGLALARQGAKVVVNGVGSGVR